MHVEGPGRETSEVSEGAATKTRSLTTSATGAARSAGPAVRTRARCEYNSLPFPGSGFCSLARAGLMSSEKTEGILIRQTDFSETSRIGVFFTREFGKISVIAKGARRLKGPFEAALDLLTVSRIVFIRKSNSSLDILTEAQLISRFKPNGRDLSSLYGGYYVAELLLGLTEEYDPHPVLYDEAVKVLERLAAQTTPQLHILRFELVMLREIGQLPGLEECVVCGTAVQPDQAYAHWVSQGGLLCENCRREGYEGSRIKSGTVAVLRRLASVSDQAWERLIVSKDQQREIRRMMTSAISHALGHRPKSLRYLQFDA